MAADTPSPGWRTGASGSSTTAADATVLADRDPSFAPGRVTAPALTARASARFTPTIPARTFRLRLVLSNISGILPISLQEISVEPRRRWR